MKVTVKRNLIVFHDPADWEPILQKLVDNHGPTIRISWVMRRELGFTWRNHQGLASANIAKDPNRMYYQAQIHLDFFNESAQSWVQLRYL
jgi:hypothetical protein